MFYRFDEILRCLHFSNNNDPRARTDRIWKLRPVVATVEKKFLTGFHIPGVLSFDEGMLPSRSKFNKTRTYMKDKPHKWGTKVFMTCCSRTAYCIRFEVYCGKKQHQSDDFIGGNASGCDNAGADAVVRNLKKILRDEADLRNAWRLIVVDRYYSSVSLLFRLLAMKCYVIGAVQTNRKGYCKEVVEKAKK
jgi:hypothetical protein